MAYHNWQPKSSDKQTCSRCGATRTRKGDSFLWIHPDGRRETLPVDKALPKCAEDTPPQTQVKRAPKTQVKRAPDTQTDDGTTTTSPVQPSGDWWNR